MRNLFNFTNTLMKKLRFKGSEDFWKTHYKTGGDSGSGSVGKLLSYKADVINRIIDNCNVDTVTDFGCGDCKLARLIKAKRYIGLDISEDALNTCMKLFRQNYTREFYLYSSKNPKTEMSMSIDVIYHLVEDYVFKPYMKNLFKASKVVLIYSSDFNKYDIKKCPWVRQRKITEYIKDNFKEWKLIKVIKNKYPKESYSNFYIYVRRHSKWQESSTK